MPVYSSLANNVDGSAEEWSTESLMATDNNGVSFLIDWDSDNLYLAWNGTDLSSNSEGADLFFYLNTSEDGSVTSKGWNGIKTLPFSADFGIVVEDSSYSMVISHSSSQWQDVTQPDIHAGWSDNKLTEISIPLSDLGNPEHIDIMAWA